MSAEEQLAALKAELEAERQKSSALQEANTGLKSQLNNQTQKNTVQKSELDQCKKWNVELVRPPPCSDIVAPFDSIT